MNPVAWALHTRGKSRGEEELNRSQAPRKYQCLHLIATDKQGATLLILFMATKYLLYHEQEATKQVLPRRGPSHAWCSSPLPAAAVGVALAHDVGGGSLRGSALRRAAPSAGDAPRPSNARHGGAPSGSARKRLQPTAPAHGGARDHGSWHTPLHPRSADVERRGAAAVDHGAAGALRRGCSGPRPLPRRRWDGQTAMPSGARDVAWPSGAVPSAAHGGADPYMLATRRCSIW